MTLEEYRQRLQLASMSHSPEGWDKFKSLEREALCALDREQFQTIAALAFYVYRQAWEGKVDWQVTLPDALPEHWIVEVPAGQATRYSSEWDTWKNKYGCPPAVVVKKDEPPIVKKDDKKKTKDKKTTDEAPPKRTDPAADCSAGGGAWDAGAKLCSFPGGGAAQVEGGGEEPVPAVRSPWTIAIVAGAGLAVVGGAVWYLRRKKR